LAKNIDRLRNPEDAPPYQFVARVGWKGGYVHIFRLQRQDNVTKPGASSDG
jgi:hypothetical protein